MFDVVRRGRGWKVQRFVKLIFSSSETFAAILRGFVERTNFNVFAVVVVDGGGIFKYTTATAKVTC